MRRSGSSRRVAGPVGFPSGTKMLFVQTAAPSGWTKDTDQNDKVLRIVSGTPSSGGTTAFSTWAAVAATGSHAGTTPAHTHTQRIKNNASGGVGSHGDSAPDDADGGATGAMTSGAGGTHTHTIDLDVAYIDIIKATKD